MTGPTLPECDAVHAEKYRGKGENFREAMNRVAASLQDDHEHYMSFRSILLNMRFMPAGRIQAAMGSLKNVTPYNCFVMPTIHDSFTDGPSKKELDDALLDGKYPPLSIMDTGKAAAITMRQGGGVGYDISTLRPRGDLIRGVQATTDGPLAFAPIYDAICGATASAGNRRGAQMLVMRCDHPDIEIFIRAKQATGDLQELWVYVHSMPDSDPRKATLLRALQARMPMRGFNMSIAVTDELMECIDSGKPFPLMFDGEVYREVDPHALWEMVMRGTYDWAEPGVLFIDTINRMNNLWYCEKIAATNPCGEQPLPPYGACLLGSVNLPSYIFPDGMGGFYLDTDLLEADLPHIVRAMDNVVDRARYPLLEQKNEAQSKRRMGIGVTGLANALEALGHPYGSPDFVAAEDRILRLITRNCYLASVKLAQEKGSFKLYDREKYAKGEFIRSLDSDVQDLIYRYGIRNSHLTSIAPTGTISFCADNVSSGIEPVFGYTQQRRVNMRSGPTTVEVPDFGVNELGIYGKRAADVSVEEHVAVLCAAQKNVDSSVSKTCNVPTNYPYDKFKDIYRTVYLGGGKGCTTYRPNGNYDDVLRSADSSESSQETEICRIDPNTGQRVGACAD